MNKNKSSEWKIMVDMKKSYNISQPLTLKDIDYKNKQIVFSTEKNIDQIFSFEFFQDINKYITKEWKFIKS